MSNVLKHYKYALNNDCPHKAVQGDVGLWKGFPLSIFLYCVVFK